MFADYIKMAAKIALIVVITTAVIALFTVVQIPTLDFTLFGTIMGKGLAFANHWIPGFTIVFPITVVCLGLQLAILLFEYGAIAWRWIFKVNE